MAACDVSREKVLILYLADVTNVARVRRQATFLSPEYDVILASPGRHVTLPGVETLTLPSLRAGRLRGAAESAMRLALRAVGRYGAAYWRDSGVKAVRQTLGQALPVDAVVVNELFALPLARSLGDHVPVIFDAHEHWTSESASWNRRQRLSMRGAHEWIVDRFVPQTAGMMTVSEGIARDFSRRTGVSPIVVTNAPFFEPLSPSPVDARVRLLHVGVADRRRRLEHTIAAVRSLDRRFMLDIVLAGDNGYRRHLEQLVDEDDRIRVLPPVAVEDLVSFANRYDIGVFLLPADFPNQVHVLPNKLFDYIQARLGVAIGPSPEMARIVNEWDCGVVSDSFSTDAFARALGQLDATVVAEMKANAHKAAKVLTANRNRDAVVSLVRSAIHGRDRTAAERVDRLDLALFDHVPSGWTSFEDRRSLLALHSALAERGRFRYLEVGCYLGSTLQAVVADDRCEHVVAIDRRDLSSPDVREEKPVYRDNSTEHMLELLAKVPGANLAKLETVDASTQELDPHRYRADLCLVDAEHTSAAALQDARFCRRVVADNGVIVFHDRTLVDAGIRRFLRELDNYRAYPLKHDLFVVELGDRTLLTNDGVKRQVPRRLWRAVAHLRLTRQALALAARRR
jgi:hypothetical protein